MVLRKLPCIEKQIYLTFDDGPCPETTPHVLDLLYAHGAQGNFFVIGTRARQNPEILQRIKQEGHGIFSHSLDHDYRNYFKGKSGLKMWIQESLQDLEDQSGVVQSIFRPPAGVLTPPLVAAATELQIPLLLWNHRFFDSVSPWSEEKSIKSLQSFRSGDIVLLHDWQRQKNRDIFLRTLHLYLQGIRNQGYRCKKIETAKIQNNRGLKHDSIINSVFDGD